VCEQCVSLAPTRRLEDEYGSDKALAADPTSSNVGSEVSVTGIVVVIDNLVFVNECHRYRYR